MLANSSLHIESANITAVKSKRRYQKTAMLFSLGLHPCSNAVKSEQTLQIPQSGIASVASSRQRRCKIEATVRTILKSHRFHQCQFFRLTEP